MSTDRSRGPVHCDRAPNFDIYLPRWLAQHNKTIFGRPVRRRGIGLAMLSGRLASHTQSHGIKYEKWRHPKVTPCSTATALSLLAAEGEVHAGKILEVVLIAGVAGAVDAEAGVEVVHFDRPQLDVRASGRSQDRRRTAWQTRCCCCLRRCQSSLRSVDLAVQVAVRRSKQGLSEGLQLSRNAS